MEQPSALEILLLGTLIGWPALGAVDAVLLRWLRTRRRIDEEKDPFALAVVRRHSTRPRRLM